MSNFECEKCGTICYDTPSGYITGCEHYPADIKKREGEERETMTTENSTDDDSASSACYACGGTGIVSIHECGESWDEPCSQCEMKELTNEKWSGFN